ncbi:EAL domain-containing protein [Yokenella regensburgei]|nr:EAL domain-containing protein [Yokenella regensburgei]
MLVLTVLLTGRQARQDEDLAIRRATRSIDSMLAEAERVISMNRAFLGQPCTPQLARQLARSAALSPHVRGVRLLQNNVTVCASLGGAPDLPALPASARISPALLLTPGDALTPSSSLLVMMRQYPEGGVAVSLNGLFLRQALRATPDLPGLMFRAGGLEMGADGVVHHAPEDVADPPPASGQYAFTLVTDPRSPVRDRSLLRDALPWIVLCLLVTAAATRLCHIWQSRRSREDIRLRRAIKAGDIRPWYQPVVDSATGEPAGCEVLARWHTRGGEVIPPERFIPLAERSGLIVPMTRSVLIQVARELGAHRQVLPSVFHLAFNLSAAHAGDHTLLQTCRALQSALPGVILVAEITERERFEPSVRLPELLPALRAAGVRVALDDFGTGYAGLSTLDQLPVDYIKLDRTFTTQTGGTAYPGERLLMAEMVTEIAHRMKLEVVAEGVETSAQRDWLKAHGVRWLQGYFYSRPLPLTEFLVWLQGDFPEEKGGGAGAGTDAAGGDAGRTG